MKNIFLIAFVCFLYEFSCQGQSLYSMENLKQSSPESLNTYLALAKKQKKTGAILTGTGSITAIAGFVVFAATYDEDAFVGYTAGSDIGGWMILIGTGVTLVGLPIWITGSTRVKKINNINANSNEVFFDLAPCRFRDLVLQKNQPGVTLRIRF